MYFVAAPSYGANYIQLINWRDRISQQQLQSENLARMQLEEATASWPRSLTGEFNNFTIVAMAPAQTLASIRRSGRRG